MTNSYEQNLKNMKENQVLIAQILHDLISHFTSLSTGLDILYDPHNSLWQIIQQSQKQLRVQLLISRFLFSYGDGTAKEATDIIKEYAQIKKCEIKGTITDLWPKAWLGLSFWLLKQVRVQEEKVSLLSFSQDSLTLEGFLVPFPPKEIEILEKGLPCQTPRESYAAYLSSLLRSRDQKVLLEPLSHGMKVSTVSISIQ